MSSPSQYVGFRVGHRVGVTLGRGGAAPVQLLSFTGSGAQHFRNSGTNGTQIASQRRTGAATFADSTGLRVDTVAGVERYLFEGYSRNQAARSDDISLWSVSGFTVAANTVEVTDPLGTNTATKITTTTNTGHNISRSYTVGTGAGQFPNSVAVWNTMWLRVPDGDSYTMRLRFRRNDNTFVEANVAITDVWQEFELDVASTLTGATAAGFFLQSPSSGAAIKTVYASRGCSALGTYATRAQQSAASISERFVDVLVWPASEVPSQFRTGAWACNVRPQWANADLANGDKRVICSTDSSNWIGFEKDSGSLYLRCYTGGALRFGTGAITVARNTDYPIIVNLSGGVMTFNGTAGSAGTATEIPGGVTLRWGGILGGTSELDGGCSEPWSV